MKTTYRVSGSILCCVLSACVTWAQDVTFSSPRDYQSRDFSGQVLNGADFSDSNCFLTNFRETKLVGAIFRDARLGSASLSYADLRKADLRNAILSNASLQNADLTQANLAGADLSGVSVQNAILRGANLSKTKGLVDGTGADFRDADLRGANLLEMKDYSNSARYTNAKYDQTTRWPRGFDLERSGAVFTASEPTSNAITALPIPPLPLPNSSVAPVPPPPPPLPLPGSAPTPQSPTAQTDPDAPPPAEIKARLEKEMWGPSSQGGTRHTYQYKSLKIAAPRLGNYRTDGTPANRPTMVYPVKVQVLIQRHFTDGSMREESKDQTYNFFKDEFGDWTYRFSQNN